MMHLLFLLQGKRLSLVWNVALLSYTGTYLKRIEKATISDHLASLLSKLENSLSRTTTLAAYLLEELIIEFVEEVRNKSKKRSWKRS
jgi:hypothetical protein